MSDRFSSTKDSIKAIAGSFGRLVFIGSTAFGIASFANFSHHKSYWNGTIERIQTVDLNMLSHMLPTKLSQALIERDGQEIQRTLNSNYGLFGLVVTDCETSQPDCEQTVQYISDSTLPWRSLLTNDTLAASTYDVLMDPPPLYPTGSYADSRDLVRDPTGLTNFGAIIGRVYYVRGVPPGFFATYSRWIKGWPASFLSDSGANRYYSLTTILFGMGGLSAWIFMELGFSQRRRQLVQSQRQQRQLEITQADLIGDAQDLRQQLKENLAENSQLIEERSQNIAELESARQWYRSQEVRLQDSSQKLKGRMTVQAQAYEKDKQRETNLQKEVQQQQQASELLKKEIADLKDQHLEGASERQLAEEKISALVKAQADKQKMLDESEIELNQVWQELGLQTEEREDQNKLVEVLSQQMEELKRQQADAFLQQQESEKERQQAEQAKERDKQRIRALEEKLRDEKKQDELRTIFDDITHKPLNLFESKVINELKDTTKVKSAAWSVHAQLDVSKKGKSTVSMLTDCVLIGSSFVAVIEAKNYSGKIYTEGDMRNSVWLSSEGGKSSIKIASSWGDNPYKQVSSYVHGAMGLFDSNFNENVSFLRRKIYKREVSFYGIVVLPDSADLSALDTDLGKFYRVTQLGELVDVLHKLEHQTQEYHADERLRDVSSVDIENCLYGRK